MIFVVQWFSDFADQAIILPLSAVVAIMLGFQRHWRAAAAWVVAVGAVLSVMLVLKLLAGACGWQHPNIDIESPSGHTASAAMVYGGLFVLFGKSAAKLWKSITFTTIVAALFGISRVILHDHSPPEVLVGAIVGIAGTVILYFARGTDINRISLPLIASFALIFCVAHGTRLPAEKQVRSFAAEHLRLMLCPANGSDFSRRYR